MANSLEAPFLEVVVTARPSWARVKSLVCHYARLTSVENITVTLLGPAISKRYGSVGNQIPSGINFEEIPALNESDSLDAVALSCVNGASALISKWSRNRPDCVLVIADRTETLGVAMTASIMQIPLIHLQGGEVSGSIDDKIRDANSKLADLHLTTNEQTAQRLINSGEDPSRVFPIGCPSIDLVAELENDSSNFSEQTASNLGGVGSDFSLEQPYGIIMFHPDTLHEVENIEWCQRLISMAEASDFHWFWFWPNPDHGSHAVSHEIRVAREKGELGNVRFIINLSPEDFVRLSARAKVMIGNSSFGIRESSYIGLPVMNLGKRQGGRQKSSNVIDCPELESVASLMSKMNNHISVNRFPPSSIYGNGSAGKHAAEIIANWVPSLKVRV